MKRRINIGGDPSDESYRYKRDVIIIEKISKKGGMIRIANMKEICLQLKAGDEFKGIFYKNIKQKGIPSYGTDMFKCTWSVDDFERILNQMIREYILCPRCSLPELDRKTCKACGWSLASKGKKKVEVEQDEDETPQEIKNAVECCKKLYKSRSIAESSTRSLIDVCIDKFWTLEGARAHKKWTDSVLKKFFPLE